MRKTPASVSASMFSSTTRRASSVRRAFSRRSGSSSLTRSSSPVSVAAIVDAVTDASLPRSLQRARSSHKGGSWGAPGVSSRRVSSGKVVDSFAEAVADIGDGATLIVGGFGLCGIPEKLIAALRERGARGLRIVSNNCGVDDFGLGILLANGQIAKMVASYVGENTHLRAAVPRRASWRSSWCRRGRWPSGCAPPAPGSRRSTRRPASARRSPRARRRASSTAAATCSSARCGGDFALVKAWRGDPLGNLVYRDTARNFNPLAAMAGRVTIAEVEELVDVGELDPDQVHTPGIFVQRILEGAAYEKRIERRTVREAVSERRARRGSSRRAARGAPRRA